MSSEPGPLKAFAERSLRVLAAEQPGALSALRTALGATGFGLAVGEERIAIRARATGLSVEAVVDGAGALSAPVAATNAATLCRLVDGAVRLPAAIEDGDLDVFGSLEELDRLERAFTIYVRACMGAPSMPETFERFRARTGEPRGE